LLLFLFSFLILSSSLAFIFGLLFVFLSILQLFPFICACPLIWFTSCPCFLSRPVPLIIVAVDRHVSKAIWALRTQIVLQKVRASTLLLFLCFYASMTVHVLIFMPALSRAHAIAYVVSHRVVFLLVFLSLSCAYLCPHFCLRCCTYLHSRA
jgi:hypothetical protein